MRLLLIEDDESLCLSLSYQLRQDGFAPETRHDGEEGLLWARQQGYDLILLDRMLPGMDGLTLLRQLRREGIHTPVIFLTALGQLSDKTGGLDAGADDYIVKPFAYDELLARIRCVLRRPAVLSGGDLLRYGDVTYDPGSLTLRRGAALHGAFQAPGGFAGAVFAQSRPDPAPADHSAAGMGNGDRGGGRQSG